MTTNLIKNCIFYNGVLKFWLLLTLRVIIFLYIIKLCVVAWSGVIGQVFLEVVIGLFVNAMS